MPRVLGMSYPLPHASRSQQSWQRQTQICQRRILNHSKLISTCPTKTEIQGIARCIHACLLPYGVRVTPEIGPSSFLRSRARTRRNSAAFPLLFYRSPIALAGTGECQPYSRKTMLCETVGRRPINITCAIMKRSWRKSPSGMRAWILIMR